MKNGEFKIEKGIPVPHGLPVAKYPWPDLDVGDSILIDERGQSAASTYKRSHPWFNYMTRREGDKWRLWRIEP